MSFPVTALNHPLFTIGCSIIAVHGLDGDADLAWTFRDKASKRDIRWLQDKNMLPKAVPNSRIMLYRYDSTWKFNAPRSNLRQCGATLSREVHDFRGKDGTNPIVFIGHSLGGLVIQNVRDYMRTLSALIALLVESL